MKDIVNLYENIIKHEVSIGCCGREKIKYVAPSSLHSCVTDWAYGKRIERQCFDISDGTVLTGTFALDKVSARFKIKLNACMPDWQKYVNDITISVNGKKIFSQDKVFFENVNLGWPTQYFDLPVDALTVGDNIIEISTANDSGGGLYVSSLCVLEFPEILPMQQISARAYVRNGDLFSVAVYDPQKQFSYIKDVEKCIFIKAEYFGDTAIITFEAKKEGRSAATAVFGENTVSLNMAEIVDNCDGFLLGMDSDDHRHDGSEETERIILTAIYSDMGNYIQFRPKYTRTYMEMAPREKFLQWVDLMEVFGVKYGLVNNANELTYLPEQRQKNFLGYHLHEPYHFFNIGLEGNAFFRDDGSLYNFKGLRESQSFGESKELFKEFLRKNREKSTSEIGLTSVGSPSLLCVYEGDAGFDRITIEPVSNINILTGAVRATSVKSWGAHIPTDWYFGVPVDEVKSAKYRLAMQYLYLNGAEYVYAENSLFKTNAFDRLDFEDEHLVTNRQYLRDFYHYTMKHPRKGKLIVDKALLYGRNEFIMWQTDDRMGELKPKDWDTNVWGKWDNKYQDCWQAAKAWMPVSDKQNSVNTPLNTKLFSGSPYGSVDVVYAEKQFEQYGTIALLGWNTMTEELFVRLKNYVRNGGALIISHCHFNTVDRNDMPPKFISSKEVGEFVGVEFGEEYLPDTRAVFFDGNAYLIENGKSVKCRKCTPVSAEVLCEDKHANGIVFSNNYGKGKVYFSAFTDYYDEHWSIDVMTHVLELAGEDGEFKCNNKNVSFTVREVSEKTFTVNVLNMNCIPDSIENFVLTIYGKTIKDSINTGEIKEYLIKV